MDPSVPLDPLLNFNISVFVFSDVELKFCKENLKYSVNVAHFELFSQVTMCVIKEDMTGF